MGSAAETEKSSRYEDLRNARISEIQARLASLGVDKSLSKLREVVASRKPPPRKPEKKVYAATSLRRSDRVKLINENSVEEEEFRRIIVEMKRKISAMIPLVKEDDLRERLSPEFLKRRCNRKHMGGIYDPLFGVLCHLCKTKKMCGEEDCKRCGELDLDQPCIGKTDCSACHSNNGVFCRACLEMRYGEEMEEVRENKKWICPHCSEEKGINPYWICNSSNCLKKRKMAPLGVAIVKARKMGYKSVAHLLMDELQRAEDGEVVEGSELGGGEVPTPTYEKKSSQKHKAKTATEQPKHTHGDDEMANRLDAFEEAVVHGMEEMKLLFIKTLEDFQGWSISNLIQNYEMIDKHIGRIEQHISTHSSDLKREVSQMKMHVIDPRKYKAERATSEKKSSRKHKAKTATEQPKHGHGDDEMANWLMAFEEAVVHGMEEMESSRKQKAKTATEQPKHGHGYDEMANWLKAFEEAVVHGMEEMKLLFIKTQEDFQGWSISNLIQNYELIDKHIGRIEQHITTHSSDLKREVWQMKMHVIDPRK